jgi:hypothetical protein
MSSTTLHSASVSRAQHGRRSRGGGNPRSRALRAQRSAPRPDDRSVCPSSRRLLRLGVFDFVNLHLAVYQLVHVRHQLRIQAASAREA